MALYAFDGTWNRDEPNPTEATNVVKFREAYRKGTEYIEGVGTHHGLVGRLVGGVSGAGGRERIREMYEELAANFRGGEDHIDIVGFSRGAALAVHFSNLLNKKGVQLDAGRIVRPHIRFLGLWDVVGSFGIPVNIIFPFQEINLAYDLTVPENVGRCFHAMALHERRQTFVLTRLDREDVRDNVEEIWFRGVHSDVGGGNGNTLLSNIALKWMLERAADCGLPIDPGSIAALDGTVDPTAPLGENVDLIRNPPRKTFPADRFHPTCVGKVLQPGESQEFLVRAPERYSWTAVRLVRGGQYSFTVPEGQTWEDGSIVCGGDGWRTEDQHLPPPLSWTVKFAERFRRAPEANWFEVIGAVGQGEEHLFRIGDGSKVGTPFVAPEDADLYAFANDLESKYENNRGSMRVEVTRVA